MRTILGALTCIMCGLPISAATSTSYYQAASQPPVAQQGIEGVWVGKLAIPTGSLRVVFHVKKKADGAFTSTLDSPDQGAKDIPVDSTTFSDRTLKIEIPSLHVTYSGKLAADGQRIEGTFTQGADMPLALVRVSKALEPLRRARPQNPSKPYPYAEREVSYENRVGGVKLAGTLTLPKTGGPFPAVVLITGSGAQDRNESLLGHQPFLVLSDYLTRRGVAVLRVDDRGIGGSTGSTSGSTTDDFVGDVLSGVAFLKTQKEIDPKRIGVCGHSEGGVIGPMAAARSGDVAFVVMMAGTGVPGDEIIYRQSRLIGKAGGLGDAKLDEAEQAQHAVFAILKQEKDPSAIEKRLRALREDAIAKLPDAQRRAAVGQEAAFKAQVEAYQAPWFRYFLSLDPRVALRKVHCPVLVLNGEKDMQVDPGQNVPEVEKALKEAGNSAVTVRILTGLNHLFQTCKTGSPTEYESIEETMSPIALKVIGDWIELHTKPTPIPAR